MATPSDGHPAFFTVEPTVARQQHQRSSRGFPSRDEGRYGKTVNTLLGYIRGISVSPSPFLYSLPHFFFFVLQGYVCTCVVVEGSRRAWARDEDASLSTDRPGPRKCTCCVCMCVCRHTHEASAKLRSPVIFAPRSKNPTHTRT